MTFSKTDLVELLVQVGHVSAQGWKADRVRQSARIVAQRMPPAEAKKLTKDAQVTLRKLRTAVRQEAGGWAPEPRKPRRRTKLNCYPYLKLTRRQGAYLHDWLKKFGFVSPKVEWRKLTKKQKQEACEWATEEIIEAFLDSEDEA